MTNLKELGFCELKSEDEYKEVIQDMEEEVESVDLGHFSSLDDIVEDLKYQDLSEKQIIEMSNARYGSVLEIFKISDNEYLAYVVSR